MLSLQLSEPITQPDELEHLADLLGRQALVGVDTESNSLYAYRERVCLVQFSTVEEDYLVDPLALDDLSALGGLFAEPEVEKIFHAAEYDILCMKRDFGFSFANVFDTMLAARILGRKEVGLGSMLEAEFGVSLDKRLQRANWGERPLPEALLTYGRQDTHYLIQLRNLLNTQLQEKGLGQLAAEDFQRLCQLDAHPAEENGASCWRISGARYLTPQQTAVLQELCDYREAIARSLDRPLFKVMGDHTLHAIATHCPGSMEEMKWLPGMSHYQMRRHGRALLNAVQRGLEAEPINPPPQPRPDGRYLARLDALRKWRKLRAQEMGVESDVVLPRDMMFRLAGENPRDGVALAEAMADSPWRVAHYGEQILRAIK